MTLNPWLDPSTLTAPIGARTSAVWTPPCMCARTPGLYANTRPRQSAGERRWQWSTPAPQRGEPGSPASAAASRAARTFAASATASPRRAEVPKGAEVMDGPEKAIRPQTAATANNGAVAGEVL